MYFGRHESRRHDVESPKVIYVASTDELLTLLYSYSDNVRYYEFVIK